MSTNTNTNILIFPSGSGVAKEIYDSLKYIRNIIKHIIIIIKIK